MATPAQAVIRRRYCWKSPSATSTTNSAVCSSFSKQDLLLHDWWLIKVDSDCHGKRLGIGGFTSRENKGVRCFSSAPIVKRHDAVSLSTVDGIKVMLNGHLNRSRTIENGFSHEVCDHFVIGFPYYWEEFAAISVDEEPKSSHFSESERVPVSDGHKMASASSTHSRNIFDEKQCPSNGSLQVKNVASTQDESVLNHTRVQAKRRSKSNLEDVEVTVRLTRSRARLLNK